MNEPDRPRPDPEKYGSVRTGPGIPFRILLTLALIACAVVPVGAFGLTLLDAGLYSKPDVAVPLLISALVAAAFLGLAAAWLAVATLTAPIRRIARAVEQVAAGEPGPPIHLRGDDELARLAESHNRISADAQRRNRELASLLRAVASYAPGDGVAALAVRAERDSRQIYGLIDCALLLVDPALVPAEEWIPADPRPVRAEVRAGAEALGVLSGHLPATRAWEPADQDLLDLFASEVGVALRNAELFAQIESQNDRLLELDAAKDEFLRGISHNLQTPLTSIRAYVDQLRASSADPAADRQLQIVAEQADRLARMVRQLLTVTRLEAGVLRPQAEVIALPGRIRRAWEALNAGNPFRLDDEAQGWLAVADPDQLDQVLWALLDNAVKYGGAAAVEVRVWPQEGPADTQEEPGAGGPPDAIGGSGEAGRSKSPATRSESPATGPRLLVTIADHGPGVTAEDRERLFGRFTRGSTGAGHGTGLGLYLSRQLLRAMGGDLWLEPARQGIGAEFTLALPGERPESGIP